MDCSLLDQLVGHLSVLIICPTMAVNYTTLEKTKPGNREVNQLYSANIC